MDKPVSYGIGSGCHNIYDSNGNLICQVFENLKDRFEIVKAVNCHDDLLAALKALRDYDPYDPGDLQKAIDMAEAAIAKAEGISCSMCNGTGFLYTTADKTERTDCPACRKARTAIAKAEAP